MLHLRITGTANPAVLLLHGAPSAAEDFRPIVEAFGRRHRFLWPDMPGYGLSEPLEGKTSTPRVMTLLEDAVLALGIKELAIVGYDLGAYRALSIALNGRLHVTDLVLLGGFSAVEQAERERLGQWAEALRKADGFSDELKKSFAERVLSPTTLAEKPDRAAEVAKWLELTKPALLADEVDAMIEARDLLPHVGNLRLRLTARVGAHDTITPPRYSEELVKRVRNARFQPVPDAGHALLVDDPHRTLEAIDEALRAQVATRRDE